jgi:ketosteroid isomerase-like protein
MNIINKTFTLTFMVLCFAFAATKSQAQTADNDAAAKEMITAMNTAADDWNKGRLDAYIGLYDPSATMMMKKGPEGMGEIKSLYEQVYFKDGMPKQNLKYTDMKVRMLGADYALLTGGFTLYGNNVPERSGVYSLVMIHTKTGWKILHDHSN